MTTLAEARPVHAVEEAPTVQADLRATVDQGALSAAITFARSAVNSRPPVPVLGCLLLEASRGVLTVTGYSYDLLAREQVLAAGATGRALVPAREIADMVRAIGRGNDVRLEVHGPKLRITGAGVEYQLMCVPLEDYPELPDLTAARPVAHLGKPAFERLTRPLVAASRDETLPILCGVRLQATDDGRLTAAATDRYRLALTDVAATTSGTPASTWLLRGSTAALAAKHFRRADRVTLAVDEQHEHLLLAAGSRTLLSQWVDGEYPKVDSLITAASAPTSTVTVDRAALRLAVAQVGLAAERNTPVRLTITADQIILEGGVGDHASARKAIEAKLAGEPIATAFNPQFLLDGLDALPGETAVLQMTLPTKPGLLRAEEAPEFTYLIMPVRMAD